MRIPTTIDGWFSRGTMRRAKFWGTRTDPDGTLVFGEGLTDRKDPAGALLHEIAHFLEIDEARCFVYGFGLSMPKVVINGQEYEDCLSFSPCAREIRVTAIQRVLHQHFKTSFDALYWATLIEDFVPGSAFASVHYEDDSLSVKSMGDEDTFEGLRMRRARRMKRDIVAQSKRINILDLWALWLRRCELHSARVASWPDPQRAKIAV